MVVVVADGAGVVVVEVVAPSIGAVTPYHSFNPLWPRQAPFFSALDEKLPSLHMPIVPAGAPAGGMAKTLAEAMRPTMRADARSVFMVAPESFECREFRPMSARCE